MNIVRTRWPKVTSKGQVTIPQDIRERAGLLPGTEMQFSLSGGSVRIRRIQQSGTLPF